ncbi:hypothetical protein BUALT_Bualt18G0103200 [Buddleja alternifolia]|uniref:Uncharacterized protein n=1 Tax=Buddleja alternifolia TaxID=168488 RepID=A0AAV6W4Z3_9LAMI|nr:hypothetical protein BUALT_Bualt18G0103200 [Buddleja alternifolia]
MAQFFFLLLYVALFISIGKGSESRTLLESIPPTGMDPAANVDESFGSGSSPNPGPSGGLTQIWKHHSISGDNHKSIAGGDVILGGFATALIATIFCYIRITRRSKDKDSQTS